MTWSNWWHDPAGVEFHPDSRLLVVHGRAADNAPSGISSFEWRGGDLRLLHFAHNFLLDLLSSGTMKKLEATYGDLWMTALIGSLNIGVAVTFLVIAWRRGQIQSPRFLRRGGETAPVE